MESDNDFEDPLSEPITQDEFPLSIEGVMEWIIRNEASDSIGQLETLLNRDENKQYKAMEAISEADIQKFNEKAIMLMNELVAVGEFSDSDLDMTLVEADINEFGKVGLRELVNNRTSSLKRSNIQDIKNEGKDYSNIDVLIDLLENGVKPFMKDSFIPNGCNNFYRQSKSYNQWRALCNRHMFKLRSEGRAIILPSKLISDDLKEKIHRSTLILAPSSNPNREGRCCLNGAYQIRRKDGKGSESLNDNIDLDVSDAYYVPAKLPTLRDLCDRAQEARSRAKEANEKVHGATIDVADAYRQITLSYGAVLHRAVEIYIGEARTPYIVFIIVNNFGESRAGHVYNIAGKYVDFALEKLMGYKCAETYIDDTIIFAIQSMIDKAMKECKIPITKMFSESALSEKKTIKWGTNMVALGWEFDLNEEVWRVAPKERGRTKLYMSLFRLLPVEIEKASSQKLVNIKTLQCIASLLTWYSAVFRVAKPFTNAIWKNIGYGRHPNTKVLLTESCIRDIQFWRVIVLASMKSPHIFSARIDQLATTPEPDYTLFTDASTSTGAGAWYIDEGGERMEIWIRWCEAELEVIQKLKRDGGISINELEFIAVMYAVISWGEKLKGKTIKIMCDNTAAISWIMKQRGSNKSPVAEYLVQVFVLYCMMMDIAIVAEHISGVTNNHADFLSRDVLLQEKSFLEETTEEKSGLMEFSKQDYLRKILMNSIVRPLDRRSQTVLEQVKNLL